MAWLNGLGAHVFSSDEAAFAIMADSSDGGLQRLNEDEPHGPFYVMILRATQLATGGRNEFLLRYPSVLFGMLLLALTYRLGRDLRLGGWASLAAMVLLGLNPQITYHVREVRPYAAMIFMMALAAWVGLRFEHLRWRGVATLTSVLALLTHYFNAPFIAGLGLWGLISLRGRARRDWLLTQAAAAVAIAFWLPTMGKGFFNSNSLNTGKTWSFILPPWETFARLLAVGAQGYREYMDLGFSIPGGLLLLAGVGLGGLVLSGRRRGWLWSLTAVPLLAYALLAWVRPVFHPKYTLPWLAFAVLGLAACIGRRPRVGGFAGLALALIMVMPTVRTLQRPYDPGVTTTAEISNAPKDLASGLIGAAGQRDAFGLGTPDPVHCYYFQHYFERSLDCILIPRAPDQSLADLTRQSDEVFATHDVLWYLDYTNPAWDTGERAQAVLGQAAVDLGADSFGGQALRLFGSSSAIHSQAQPSAVTFGAVARLDAAWVRAGHNLHVVLIWTSLSDRPALDAKVFVHLTDASGAVLSQDDSVPVNWTRPLSTWARGETILDVHVLDLAGRPLQESDVLHVGLYDATTLDRLPALDPKGAALADQIATVDLGDAATAK